MTAQLNESKAKRAQNEPPPPGDDDAIPAAVQDDRELEPAMAASERQANRAQAAKPAPEKPTGGMGW